MSSEGTMTFCEARAQLDHNLKLYEHIDYAQTRNYVLGIQGCGLTLEEQLALLEELMRQKSILDKEAIEYLERQIVALTANCRPTQQSCDDMPDSGPKVYASWKHYQKEIYGLSVSYDEDTGTTQLHIDLDAITAKNAFKLALLLAEHSNIKIDRYEEVRDGKVIKIRTHMFA